MREGIHKIPLVVLDEGNPAQDFLLRKSTADERIRAFFRFTTDPLLGQACELLISRLVLGPLDSQGSSSLEMLLVLVQLLTPRLSESLRGRVTLVTRQRGELSAASSLSSLSLAQIS